jgi:putative solute:sodium symporter small subunit
LEPQQQRREIYWKQTGRVTVVLMILWFVAGLGVHFFARDLNFRFFGWPFSFWMAAQGSLLIFLLIVVAYVWIMERLDREHGFEEDPG